jgi:LAO/AO transport system kinase
MSSLNDILSGNRYSISRLLTAIENDVSNVTDLLSEVYFHAGNAHLVGITGASGTGKSSLVNQLAKAFRQLHSEASPLKIGIIAVDPSSPFTGGAILGDRIRMKDLVGDPGIFIRSVATRGVLGGLAASTSAMAQVLDAAGYRLILIETVGAGQSEVEIANLAHTIIVVESPGMGDDIQAIKSGIMEIGDIFVINKADLQGVEEAERVLRANLQFAHLSDQTINSSKSDLNPTWIPPIIRTIAINGYGIEMLVRNIIEHKEFLINSDLWKIYEARRMRREFHVMLRDHLYHRWLSNYPKEKHDQVLADVISRKISPWQALKLFNEW